MDGPRNRNRQSPSARVGIGDVIQVERPLVAEEERGPGDVVALPVTQMILEWKVCTGSRLRKNSFSKKLTKGTCLCGRREVQTTKSSFRNQKTMSDVVRVKEL
jgi:hypothetical protein